MFGGQQGRLWTALARALWGTCSSALLCPPPCPFLRPPLHCSRCSSPCLPPTPRAQWVPAPPVAPASGPHWNLIKQTILETVRPEQGLVVTPYLLRQAARPVSARLQHAAHTCFPAARHVLAGAAHVLLLPGQSGHARDRNLCACTGSREPSQPHSLLRRPCRAAA